MSSLQQHPGCNPNCRACHYKTLNYPLQVERKQNWAGEKLESWSDSLQQIVPAPGEEQIGYRNKSWLRCQYRDGEYSFGMLRAASVGGKWIQEFISWDTCPVHSVAIQTVLRNLKRELHRLGSPEIAKSLLGIWIGTPHLVFVTSESVEDVIRRLDFSRLLVPPIDQVWFHHVNQIGRRVFGHREIISVFGSGFKRSHPIRAFRQVAGSLLREARADAVSEILRVNPEFVLDLYSGTGELSCLLPAEVSWIGIEISKEASEFASLSDLEGRPFHLAYVGSVEHRLRDPIVLERIRGTYVLYINPPRSGLGNEASAALKECISQSRPTSVVYLSCSASSLARDLRFFESCGFKVNRLQPYDFFPQTEHFETLAFLTDSLNPL
ncbi:MAG: hypothetical protein H7301_09525 [Cryobacterium sp.]|nr:hypothetical protein [Oligoflexia bacterium]